MAEARLAAPRAVTEIDMRHCRIGPGKDGTGAGMVGLTANIRCKSGYGPR